MNELIKVILSLSVSGTLLFFLILGLKQLYKNKFSRRWQYYIWIIVVLRFLLPFAPDTINIGSLFGRVPTTVLSNENFENSEKPVNPSVPTIINTNGNEPKQLQIPANKNTIDNVFIGANSTIMYNTVIESNVIIAAGSVVHGHIPSGVVIAGNPAKVIGKFEDVMIKRESSEIPSAKDGKDEIMKYFWGDEHDN